MSILFSFSFFSVLGWLLEVAYRSFSNRRFVNPGLLKGPYLPIYGTGAVLLMAAASLLEGSHALTRAFAYFAVTTGLELACGLAAERFFQSRLWDYSDQRFNYRGHVCLTFSLCWVALAFAFEYLVLPPYQSMLTLLSPAFKGLFAGAAVSIMLMDFLAAGARRFLRPTPQEKALLEARFNEAARPLLERPEVAKLSQCKHHREKTRLEHSKEVAYLSLLWGNRLSLDGEAIVRGALLHDLFHYDWLREGPGLHGFRHPAIALRNAREITALTEKEADIIKKHMWPLTVVPPRYMESLVVSLVDTFCSAKDYLNVKNQGARAKAAAGRAGPEAGDRQR